MIRSGKICLSLLYNYLLSPSNSKNKNSDGSEELYDKKDKLKSISKVFENYGGILAKLSQLLCMDDQNNSSFSDCKPFSQEGTIEYIKKIYHENKNDLFSNIESIDFKVLNSGSIGQVHKAVYINKDTSCVKDVVIKVQYVGIVEQINSDIQVLDLVINFLYSLELSDAITNIKTKLFQELDYKNEVKNQEFVRQKWEHDSRIIIPEIVPELCVENILCMNFVNGMSFTEFSNVATVEQKKFIGQTLVEFIFENIYKNKIFYSDIHYGNFLINYEPESLLPKLCVLDFGCIHYIKDDLVENIKLLHKVILEDDKEQFLKVVKNMNIITSDISEKSFEYMYEYFKIQYEPWITKDFEFTEEKLKKSDYKNLELMKEWNLPSDMVYFNKIPYGLFHLLTKLNLKHDFTLFFEKLIL